MGWVWGDVCKGRRGPWFSKEMSGTFPEPVGGVPRHAPERWVEEEDGEVQTHIPASEMLNNPTGALREPTGTRVLVLGARWGSPLGGPYPESRGTADNKGQT